MDKNGTIRKELSIKKILFSALAFIFASAVFPQEDSAPDTDSGGPPPVITNFNITGLKRTKEYYMRNLLSQFEGEPAAPETLEKVETVLRAENLFDEIEVSAAPVSEGGASVSIALKEKISFLPLPMAAFSDGSFMAGLFVIDMNAFGLHDFFALGGMFSADMRMGMTAYAKQPHNKNEFGFAVTGSVTDRENTFADAHDREIAAYDAFLIGTGAQLLYKPSAGQNVSAGFNYKHFRPRDTDFVSDLNQWTASGSWGLSSSSWNGIFLSASGISASGTIYFTDDADYRTGVSLSAGASFQLPVAQKIRLLGAAAGFAGKNLHYLSYQGRSAAGVSVLPSDFKTLKILGLSAGAEFCVAKIRYGTLSVYAQYQTALAQDWDESLYVAHGPEAGLCVYLAKIAFPAISVGGSYNITNSSWQYSIAAGVSF